MLRNRWWRTLAGTNTDTTLKKECAAAPHAIVSMFIGIRPRQMSSANDVSSFFKYVVSLLRYFMLCNSAPGPEAGLPGRISAGF